MTPGLKIAYKKRIAALRREFACIIKKQAAFYDSRTDDFDPLEGGFRLVDIATAINTLETRMRLWNERADRWAA